MNYKIFQVMLLLFIICLSTMSCFTNQNIENKLDMVTEQSIQKTDDLEVIKLLLNDFRSGDKKTQEEAQNNILKLSTKSNEFRDLAIEKLLEILKSQNDPIIRCDNPCYTQWRLSVETLGKMKAKEAIDDLVKRLDFNNGATGLSLVWFPVAESLLQIGSPSIPKLIEVFSEKNNELRSHLAIHVLYEMENGEAKTALEDLLKQKISGENKAEIKRLLTNWSRDKR